MTTSEKKHQIIPLSKIKRPDRIDRISISEEDINDLAENIREQGLLQDPLVRKVGGEYEIIFGDRRILAVTKLGWIEVGCSIAEMDDAQAAEVRASENLQRKDLTVIEEAQIYENLHKKHGKTINQISKKIGKSPGLVKRRLDLLVMPQCLQDALHAEKINYGVAEALWPISDPASLDYYLGFACDHGVTVVIARQWAQDWKGMQRRLRDDGQSTVSNLESPALRPTYIACDLCEQPELVENLTTIRLCVDCAKRLNKAKFESG